MTIFIAHAPQDAAAAASLETHLERRGLFVETETGERGFRPLQFTDVVVMLISKDSVFSPYRLQFEKRALDAWAEQKLILVKLDHNFAPVGLRDLPFIEASFEPQRDLVAWAEVHKQAQEKMRPPPPASSAPSAPPRPQARGSDRLEDGTLARKRAPETEMRKGAPLGAAGLLITILCILPGLAALTLMGSIWLANRIGPTPGTFLDMLAGVGAFGERFGLSANGAILLALGSLALMILALIFLLFRAIAALERRPRAEGNPSLQKMDKTLEGAAEEADALGGAGSDQSVFVSYARANSGFVLPVVEAVKKAGRRLWLDQEGIQGEGWAGQIVRAIRSSEGVCVMCSAAAFESDHVKREVYLADRYKKPLLPVFIENAAPPEDFEYFFAGVQSLNLFEAPEAERAALLSRALNAA